MVSMSDFFLMMKRAFMDLMEAGATVEGSLLTRGVKGTTKSCDCPIANYLRPIVVEWATVLGLTVEEFEVLTNSVDIVCRDTEGGRVSFVYFLPPLVQQFIYRFDHGKFPELVAV